MVIHDLRNPTNNIEYALREVIKVLKLDGQAANSRDSALMNNTEQSQRAQQILNHQSSFDNGGKIVITEMSGSGLESCGVNLNNGNHISYSPVTG
jgi:hypothetical protein